MIKALVAAALVLGGMLGAPLASAAEPRAASLVVDANTGAVLHNKNGDVAVYPASLTKMMTLYLTFELIEAGRLSYDSKIKMTESGAAAAPSKLDLEPGEELSVLDAIKALVTKSANDVAISLAQHIGGTEANFARLMTKKARELGMRNTTFRNASGLPDPEQTTTARDMVTLGLRLQDDFPRHYGLFSTRTFAFRGKTYRNHNTLLARYKGSDGIKTGYTRASGFNLVSSVHRDGKHVVAAVFGGDTARKRNATMASLLSSALAKASTKVSRQPALVARATPARRPEPMQLAQAPSPPPAPAPAPTAAPPAREPASVINVAKVRSVRIDGQRPAAETEQQEQPVFAVAGAADIPPPRPAAVQTNFPRFVAETGALRPSTLDAQAAHIEAAHVENNAEPAPASQQLAALEPAPRRAAAGGARGPFDIQIGAYANTAEAQRRMADARQRAGGKLDAYNAVASPVASGSSKLYRARFRGFEAASANATCSHLKSLKIDCFVIRAE